VRRFGEPRQITFTVEEWEARLDQLAPDPFAITPEEAKLVPSLPER
jgi:hypothetical protein